MPVEVEPEDAVPDERPIGDIRMFLTDDHILPRGNKVELESGVVARVKPVRQEGS